MLGNLLMKLTIFCSLFLVISPEIYSQSSCRCDADILIIFDDCSKQQESSDLGVYVMDANAINPKEQKLLKLFLDGVLSEEIALTLSDNNTISHLFRIDGTRDHQLRIEYYCDESDCYQSEIANFRTMAVYEVKTSDVTCAEFNDGIIQVISNDNQMLLNYDNQIAFKQLENLDAGEYKLLVSSSNGCSNETVAQINKPKAIEANYVNFNYSCENGYSNYVKLEVSGGTPPYSFDWNNDGMGDEDDKDFITFDDVKKYEVVISDINKCSLIKDVSTEINAFKIYELKEGSISIGENMPNNLVKYNLKRLLDVNGGDIDQDGLDGSVFEINFYKTEQDANNWDNELPYNYTAQPGTNVFAAAKNINECIKISAIVLNDPSFCLQHSEACDNGIPVELIPLSCINGSLLPTNGSYEAFRREMGGTEVSVPNRLVVIGGKLHFDPSNGGGNYRIYYTIGGVRYQGLFDVQVVSPQILVTQDPVCGNQASLAVRVNPIGGSMQGSAIRDSLVVGTNKFYFVSPPSLTVGNTFEYIYTYTQQNSSGLVCTKTTNDFLSIISYPIIDIGNVPSEICESSELNLVVDINFAEGNTSYQWFKPNATVPFTTGANLNIDEVNERGYYRVRVEQANLCFAEDSAFIDVIELPKLSCRIDAGLTCFGQSDAEAFAGVINATNIADYSFLWSTGATTQLVTNLSAGSYTVTVTNERNCVASCLLTILSPPQLIINCTSNIVNPLCFGQLVGSNSIDVTGGIPPYRFSFDKINFSTINTFSNLGAGDYKIYVSDSSSCIDSCEFTITQPPLLRFTLDKTDLSCFNSGDGVVTVNATGGTSPYRFAWSNGATTQTISSLLAGSYNVTVTDANNCTANRNIVVNQPTEIRLNLINQDVCLDFDTQITSSPTGGVPGYQYQWSLSNGPSTRSTDATNTNIINGIIDQATIDFSTFCLKPGRVVLLNRVTDANGCIKVDSVTINAQSCFDLAIRKKKVEDKLYYVGDAIEYEIEVFNQGSIDALNLSIKDQFDTALLFDFNQNIASETENENDWNLTSPNLIETNIAEIKAGASVTLVVFFTIDPATSKLNLINNSYVNEYQSRIDAVRVKDQPIDQDDTDNIENEDFNKEVDDEICDTDNVPTECTDLDDLGDEDRYDFDVVVLCDLVGNVASYNFCLPEDLIINGWNINTAEYRAALDPAGDGDGLTIDGDIGNEITSFHATYLDALNNVAPIGNTVPISSSINVYGRLIDKNGCINASRLNARVTIQPAIISHPSSTSVILGEENICLTVATSFLNPRFQWKLKVGNTYQDIPNATSDRYCLPSITQQMDRSNYKVEVSDANGTDLTCGRLSNEAIIAIESDLKLACKNLVNISLDGNCLALITPAMILEGARNFANARVEIRTSVGVLVPNPVTSVYVGQTLTVTVFDITNGNSCWSSIKIEDKLGPVITCPIDYTVSCANFGFSPPLPVYADACDATATIRLVSERFVELDCNRLDNLIAYKEYTYQAKDKQGNLSALCTFRVNYQNINIASVTMPTNIVLECSNSGTVAAWDSNGNGKPDPLETGVPRSGFFDLLVGSVISSNGLGSHGYCKVNITYNDSEIKLCGNTYKIVREWIVIEWCSGNVRNHFQTITIEDTIAPTFTCLTNGVTVNTNQHRCTADYQVPTPTAIRDCNSTTWTMSLADPKTILNNDPSTAEYKSEFISQDPVSKAYFAQYLPLGVSWIRYAVTDECDNTSYCYLPVTVVDTEIPTPVCDEYTVISLDDKGRARLFANTVDDGSHDNCSAVRFGVRRMNNACAIAADSKIVANINGVIYYSFVDFCCSDQVNNKQLVEMIVLDENNNYNFCMTNIEIQQKTLPKLNCPTDITVDCEQGTSPIALNSYATFTAGCPIYYITFVDGLIELDCSEKNIVRTWQVKENVNNTTVISCVQRIYIRNLTPFDFNTVVFPPNVTLVNKCNAAKDFGPTNPATGGYPKWINIGCSQVGASYIDQVFENVPDACFKIIRNWTVIDWCTFDLSKPSTIRNHQQIIKVIDTEKPTPICDEMIFFVNQACNSDVRIVGRATDSCTPEDKISYSYRVDLGGDGTYTTTRKARTLQENLTVGTHAVEWTVEDQCGNTGVCVQRVIVRDTIKPTPYCLSSITTVLMPSTLSVAIWAKDYNIGATDNCTKKLKFTFGLNPPVDTKIKHFYKPSGNGSVIATEAEYNAGLAESWDPVLCTSGRVYDCDQLGLRDIVIYVHDDSGNYDFCTVKIRIQDNTGNCGLSRLAKADGVVSTPKGELMFDVEVTLLSVNSTETLVDITNDNGQYLKVGLAGNVEFAVQAYKTDDYLNGVSTLDLVLIQRHILGIEKITDPLLFLAADINNDKRITAGDLSDLRKVILGVNSAFTNNTAWKFIQKSVISNNVYPYDLPTKAFFTSVNDTKFTNDFYGIKIGDLSADAKANANSALANTRSKSVVLFATESIVKANADTKISLLTDENLNINGLQLAISLHPDVMVSQVLPRSLSIKDAHYHIRIVDGQQLLTISWSTNDTKQLSKNDVLFDLVVRANRTLSASQVISISKDTDYNEMVLSDLSVKNISLSTKSTASIDRDSKLKVYQNIPNPFSDFTTIKYYLPEDGDVTITIVDIRGKLVLERKEGKTKGDNELQLSNATLLNSRGILFATVRTGTETQTIKMIMME